MATAGYIEEEQHDDEAALDAEEMAVTGREWDEEGFHSDNDFDTTTNDDAEDDAQYEHQDEDMASEDEATVGLGKPLLDYTQAYPSDPFLFKMKLSAQQKSEPLYNMVHASLG
ncbi:Hypothetical predicted protein [Scomber scombrus]|uniref:Uncharacterized protein n=1 Tax=Scomber scombrus TaxID=13677 RepID=A0AAV1PVZ8_SCOSC